MRQHLARVADDEHGADRMALASLPADLHGQIDDRPQRLQRHLRIELAQVLGAEAFQMFAEMDDAEAVDGFGLVLADVDAVVQGDHVGSLTEFIAAAPLRAGPGSCVPGSASGRDRCRERSGGDALEACGERAVLGGDEEPAAVEVRKTVSQLRSVSVKQHGVGRQCLHQLPSCLQQRNGLRSESHESPLPSILAVLHSRVPLPS